MVSCLEQQGWGRDYLDIFREVHWSKVKIQAFLYESTVLETYYSNSNGEVIPPVSSFTNQVLRGKRQLVTLQVGQLSQLSSTSLMTEHVRVEVKKVQCCSC